MNPDKLYDDGKWACYGGHSPVINLFRYFHPLNVEMEYIINTQTFPLWFKKNKFISSPLNKCNNSYLLMKGIVKGYIKEGKEEVTTWMAREGELIDYIANSGFQDEYADSYIMALEDVEAIAIPQTMLKQLYLNFDLANYIGRILTQLHYAQACERVFISRLQSAERRYLRFKQSYPYLINRVPLKHIASFLCMRLETLSRVRAKLAGHPKK